MPNHKMKNNTNFKHGMFGTRFYRIWSNMIQRTSNPKRGDYYKYGSKNIKVCQSWKTFANFMNDMYASYQAHIEKYGEKETQLDRVDSLGNYEPSNCRWVTLSEQRRNTSRMVYYEYNGVKLCLTDWMLILGVPKITLWDGLNKHKKTIKDFFETKFGSPQKEPNDCMNVSYNRAGELIKNAKPDPRFVEVGRIGWPKQLTHINQVPPMDSTMRACGYFDGWNNATNACKAAVEAAGRTTP